MEQITISDLLLKFPTLQDQRIFLKESGIYIFYFIISGFYFPTYRGFDSKFFISFIRGEKKVRYIFVIFFKLLKIGQVGGTNFPFFTKSNTFTRSHLLSYFKNLPELKCYLQDDISDQSIIREYLLNVSCYYIIPIGIILRKK